MQKSKTSQEGENTWHPLAFHAEGKKHSLSGDGIMLVLKSYSTSIDNEPAW